MSNTAQRERRLAVNGVELDVVEAGRRGDPIVILAHGFPESSYSWRHQLGPLADAGYHVLAPDQRGYGRSSRPGNVGDYGIEQLSGDLIGLADHAKREGGSTEKPIFVGHDWGALIVWDLGRLHPNAVKAIVAVSVPYVDWPAKPTDVFRMLYGDNFFYILYFQAVGPAETEMGADPRKTMTGILWGASADGYRDAIEPRPAAGTGFLDVMGEPPAVLPAWLKADDIDHYTKQFTESGFFGPVSYYRNLDANYQLVTGRAAPVAPTYFIGGSKDMVIARDLNGLDRMRDQLPDYRGHTIIDGVGHWTQQEAPLAFNDALLGFLKTLA